MSSRVQRLSPYVKYPFIITLDEYMRRFYGSSIPITHILSYGKDQYIEYAVSRVRAALRNLKYIPTSSEDVELSAFYIGLLISSILGKWVLGKYVDSEVKRFYEYLVRDSDEMLVKVAGSLGVKLEYVGDKGVCGEYVVVGYEVGHDKPRPIIHCLQFRVKIPTYLEGVSRLWTEPKWKLVNQYVKGGYVYLTKKDAARILQEFIKLKLINTTPDLSDVNVGGKLGEVISKLRSEVPEVKAQSKTVPKGEVEVGSGGLMEEAFPPCIGNIVNQLRRSEHLSHHQRFTLATFLLNAGANVDYVLELFKLAPDFNEKIARYQIEHLAGLRGSRRKYMVYSCDKMRSLGMCVADCGVRNPLLYYRARVRDLMMSKKETQSSHSQGS